MPLYYEFDVTLKNIRPKIWRRIQLPVTATFGQLHDAIQHASGSWEDAHPHAFSGSFRADEICGTPGDDGFGNRTRDSSRMRLSSWFPLQMPPRGRRPRCVYTYDFGDNWKAEIVLRRVFESEENFRRRLVAGERRFPPEDCGGTFGYELCCRALRWADAGFAATEDGPAESEREELLEYLEWLGDWRPDDWDLAIEKVGFDR